MHAHSDNTLPSLHPHTHTHSHEQPPIDTHTPQTDLKIYVVIKHEQGINFRCQRHLLLSRFDYNQSPVIVAVTVASPASYARSFSFVAPLLTLGFNL